MALVLLACGDEDDDKPSADAGADAAPAEVTYAVAVRVTQLGEDESYEFSLGTGNNTVMVSEADQPARFAMELAEGATYRVRQTSGPRTCTLSDNRIGTIATADVEVTADCGLPPTGFALGGTVRAPLDAQLVLQNNAGDDLAVTVVSSPNTADNYDITPFEFATRLSAGTPYALTVKTAPAGQTCSVYRGATGTLPVEASAVTVGCEYTYDLVSRSSDDSVRGSYYDSSAPVIGGSTGALGATTLGYGEGRFVAFVSSAGSARRQVFWRDLLSGDTELVSAAPDGAEGNGDSFAPSISGDGLTVAFESHASNLVGSDENGVRDVFTWSALDKSLKRVSVGAAGGEANSESFEPTLSGDGRWVAFSSGASNLTSGVAGTSTINVVLRDLVSGTNTLVSADALGNGVGGSRPALSEDGSRLAFYSFAANLVPGDANGLWDIFVYDLPGGPLSRVSLPSGGGERNQGSESASRVVAPTISGNGRHVAFATTATNMVAGDTNGMQDVFVVDTQTGSVVRASVDSAGAEGNGDSPVGQGERIALAADGSWVAFSTMATNLGAGAGSPGPSNVVMHDLASGVTRAVTDHTSGSVGVPSISRSAAYVVFGTSTSLDARFPGSGLFSRFTGIKHAWWWAE